MHFVFLLRRRRLCMLKRPIYSRLHGESTTAARIHDKNKKRLSPDVLVTMAEMTYSIYFLHIYLSSILSSFLSLCMGPICISSFCFLVLCLPVCVHLQTCTLNCLMDFPGLLQDVLIPADDRLGGCIQCLSIS